MTILSIILEVTYVVDYPAYLDSDVGFGTRIRIAGSLIHILLVVALVLLVVAVLQGRSVA